MKLRLTGAALVIGALVLVVVAYTGKPDASTCQFINNVYTQVGDPATCSSSPSAVLLWLALALGVTGIVAVLYSRRNA